MNRLDAIFITHLHGDHILGLPGLLNSLSIYERNRPLTLIGPAGLRTFLDSIFSHTSSYLRYELNYIPTEDFQPGAVVFQTDFFEARLLPLEHKVYCTGFKFIETNKKPKFNFYRAKELGIPNNYFSLLKQGNQIALEDGRVIQPEEVHLPLEPPFSYAYCSDTRFLESLAEHLRETNLLYHEATFLHALKSRADETFHSTAREAATIAQMAQVKRLLLGHFSARYKDLSPLLEEACEIFPHTDLAVEGNLYLIKDYA